MDISFRHFRSMPIIFVPLLAALILFGCEQQSAEVDPHAGHDHGPGEHVDAAAVDPHAGHDHGPGEHGQTQQVAAVDPHAGHDHGPGEHPAETQEELDWCLEHAVPESECSQCHPELIPQYKADFDWCGPHELPESHCRLCHPDISFPQETMIRERALAEAQGDIAVSLWFRPNSPICATNGALIQFASAKTAEKTGLSLQMARPGTVEEVIEAPAEVTFDETNSTVVASTVSALVSRWLVSPGDELRSGEILAIVSSPEIAELQSRLLSAHAANTLHEKEHERYEKLLEGSLISQNEFDQHHTEHEQAKAEYVAARGLLAAAGLSISDIEDVITHGRVANSFALRSPSDGVLVERAARLGELKGAGEAFGVLADPNSMWIEARLTEEQIRQVSVGQPLLFASDGRGVNRVGARVIWVSRFMDQHSRTGIVRAEVVDPYHGLQAGEFGRASILRSTTEEITLVPKDAVQWEGCCNVVFVKENELRYRPRKVEIVGGTGPYYQVTGSNLNPGDEVVVDGSFLLKTELKKASLGAGCCGLEPIG